MQTVFLWEIGSAHRLQFDEVMEGERGQYSGRTHNRMLSFEYRVTCCRISRYWNPNTSGVDFFIRKLGNENSLVVPPVSIVSRTLHYLFHQKTNATAVIPLWQSANYWLLITLTFTQYIAGGQTFKGKEVLEPREEFSFLFNGQSYPEISLAGDRVSRPVKPHTSCGVRCTLDGP